MSGVEGGSAMAVDGGHFETIYAVEYAGMVRLARLLTGSDTLSEELTQEAFIRLHAHLTGLANPIGYLRTTLVNLCRDQHRRRAIEERIQFVPPPPVLDAEIDETWHALGRLPEAQRVVVVLRYYADLPEAEIAQLVCCRVGKVKSRLHRAIAQLRKDLS